MLGKRFGRLVVTELLDNYMCKCKCDCGNEVEVYKGSLISGATKSCGCYNIEKLKERREDLTGKFFGRWKVLEYTGNGVYKCECSCEKHTVSLIHAKSLKLGNSTSCGCIQHEKRKERIDSFLGRKYGDYIVDSVVDYTSRRVYFIVKCKNGHEKKVREDNLIKLKTCTECNKKEKPKKKIKTVNIGDRFGKLKVLSIYKKNNRTMCKCRCDCGNELEIYKGGIYSRKSCGKCKKENLVGMTFGRWYVDSYNELLGKWKCICSCDEHNISYITTGDLKSGHTKSCGCYAVECVKKRQTKDLAGQKFGKLTVIEKMDGFSCVMWKCKCECGSDTVVSSSNLVHGHVKSCGKCNLVEESTIRDFITELVPNVKIEKPRILCGKEIDIYIPEYKFGIEYNGSIYHASLNSLYKDKPKNYHQQKFLLAKEKGIHLINIFDVDWKNNEEKIKMYLKDLLTQKNKIYARKCELRNVEKEEAIEFLDKYHLQCSCSRYMKINIGLFYKGELISLMSFGDLRMKEKVDGEFELHRYVVKSGYTVIGGAKKIFSEFVKRYNPLYIRSYSDNDYFTGNIYETLGFDYIKQVTPRYYWYYKNKELKREKCMISKLKSMYTSLYNESINMGAKNKEDYIMTKLGACKVYRCGNTLWKWKSN